MAAGNPYESPDAMQESGRSTFSPDGLPFILRPPRWVVVISLVFAFLCGAISVSGIVYVTLFSAHWVTAVAVAVLFGACSYAAATAPGAVISIDTFGVRIGGVRDVVYSWGDIRSWRIDEKSGLLLICDSDGKEHIIANLAVTSRRLPEIASAFAYFLGPSTKSGKV